MATAVIDKGLRGVKRRCGSCTAPFYDMLRSPIHCPKCGVLFRPGASLLPSRPKGNLKPAPKGRRPAGPVPAHEPQAAAVDASASDTPASDSDGEAPLLEPDEDSDE